MVVINILLVVSLILCAVSQNVPLTRNNLNEIDPLATCNDGTSAVAYTRSGTGTGANRFVIRLQGGGWCFDQESCDSRAKYSPYWITSNVCPDVLYDNETISNVPHEGILSSTPKLNPTFYNWNHIYLWYCSSDTHNGNKSKSINGWSFNGKNIVRATMRLAIQKLNLAAATDVLLTGDSAGGVGTVNNADFIGSFIYSVAPNANYRAFADCSWFLNIPSYGSGYMYFENVAKGLITMANAQYNENCVNKLGSDNQWMCFCTQYSWTYLETMAFYAEFQFDSANLGMDSCPEPFNASTQAYALNFRKEMLGLQSNVPYLFSASCYLHETIDSSFFSLITIGNVSISDAVSKWFFAGTKSSPPPTMRYVDTCSGVACNPTCGK